MSKLLERLRKCEDDRGMMANLRCVLVESKKHRAWPVLHRLGVPIRDSVAVFIAGLFAAHPEEDPAAGNFGSTCKSIERKRKDRPTEDNKLTPTERRFQHLLTADTEEELHDRILRMVLMAKSEGVAVNYTKLETDLRYARAGRLSDRVKTDWAEAFWTSGTSTDEEAERSI